MKKITTFILLILVCAVCHSQVVLTFTGHDTRSDDYVQLSYVVVTNVTQGWTDTLVYPDTVVVLTENDGTGIIENADNNVFGLSQNNPNPFNGTTNVELNLTEVGKTRIEITDVTGRTVETLCVTALQPGIHKFHVNIADAGIYFLTARQNGKTSSVKMVNNGTGTKNSIEYTGTIETNSYLYQQLKNGEKGHIYRPFAYGDQMEYVGYTYYLGVEFVSEVIRQALYFSEPLTLNFLLPFICGTSVKYDIDGNLYNTVQIGTQCWMKENLKTTRYANGTYIPRGTERTYDIAYWYYPGDDEANKETGGLLYNWKAMMGGSPSSSYNPSGVQGICPNGWHLPSDAEWYQMTQYVSSQSEYWCDSISSNIASALAAATGWENSDSTCNVGNNQSANNATDFNALPVGNFFGNYVGMGQSVSYWTTTEANDYYAHYCALYYNRSDVLRTYTNKYGAFSVRCILNR